jgi:hypothetical protein
MVKHAPKVPAIDPAAASLASHEVLGIVALNPHRPADVLAARDYPIFEEFVWHFGHRHFGCIAGRARRSGTAAATGTWSFPRPLRMVLADPSAIIASRAVSHAKHLSPERIHNPIERRMLPVLDLDPAIEAAGAIGPMAVLGDQAL